MKKRNVIGTLALLTALTQVLLLVYSCGTRKQSLVKEQLKGTWNITQVGTFAINPQPRGDLMTFQFDFEKGMAGGMGYCNSYGSSFTLSDKGDCLFNAVYSTRMGCDGNRLESVLGVNLEKSKKIVLKGDTLYFYDNSQSSGEPLLVMQKAKGIQ